MHENAHKQHSQQHEHQHEANDFIHREDTFGPSTFGRLVRGAGWGAGGKGREGGRAGRGAEGESEIREVA